MPIAGSQDESVKLEDAAHSTGAGGIQVLAVRNDTAASLAGASGDYIPLTTDSLGRLWASLGTMPAAAATTDTIGATHRTDKISDNLTELTPKFKSQTISASSTDTSVVAAVTAKRIRVLSLAHQCAGTATTATYESDGGSDTRLHKVLAGANGGQILPFNPVGWFQTLSGEALIITTGAGSDTDITLTYIEV